MSLIRLLNPAKESLDPSVVCLGFFDGIHAGHQAIIHACLKQARTMGLVACVHSYDIPPVRLLKPENEVLELTPLAAKTQLLEAMGVEVLALSRFDRDMMGMPGASFFEDILLSKLRARHIVAGYDHRFGFQGDTDTTALQALCDGRGIGLTVVPAVKTASGEVVSSTAIREALLRGNLTLAGEMLGRPPDDALLARVKRYQDSVSS